MLVFGPDGANNTPAGFIVPKKIQDDWMAHPTFGARFRQFLDTMHEEQPEVSLILNPDQPSPQATNDGSSPSKNRRVEQTREVDASHCVPNSEEVPLLVVPLVGVTSGKGNLNVYAQNKMRLVNDSDSEPLVVRRGMMLAGFGRGKWGVKDENCSDDSSVFRIGWS